MANAFLEDRGYLVKLTPFVENGPLYTMSALYQGELVSENFTPPEALSPEDITISNISHHSFHLTLPKGNQFVNGVIVRLEDFLANIGTNDSAPVLRSSTFLYPDNTQGPLVTAPVSGLSPGRLYSVRVQHTTQVGEGLLVSPEYNSQLWTAPLSSPTAVTSTEVTTHSASLHWSPPDIMATFNNTLSRDNITYRITTGCTYIPDYQIQCSVYFSKIVTSHH